jgi:transposase
VPWTIKRTLLERGRALRSDRKSLAQRRSAAVAGCRDSARLRRWRGEDLETVSRALGVTAATLTGWLDAFLAAGEAALTIHGATGEELESDRLKASLGAARIERDLLHEKIALLEADRPFARRRRKP